MFACDTNRSGFITYSEAVSCGGTQFWDLIKPFDSNRDNLLSKSEIYTAVQYYHTNSWSTLLTTIQETSLPIPDFNVTQIQSFLS